MPSFNYTTPAQFRDRIRRAYKNARGFRACRLAFYISSFNLTDTQLKNLFEVTNAQLPALKTKLANATQRYNDVIVEAGE